MRRVDADLDVSAVPEALEVRGVSKLLRRAIRNLLENAAATARAKSPSRCCADGGTVAEVRV